MRAPPRLPRLVVAIFRALLPIAERDEVLADLQAEYEGRAAAQGRRAAWRWAWHQGLGSVPAMCRRSWWRGMTGFEPHANRMQPGGPMFESWIMDFRYAVRRLLKRPTYAALAVLTLALGAGGTAAIFSLVRTLLLDPLPIAREEQVGVLWFDGSWNEQEFLRLRPNFAGFQTMAAYRPNDQTLETPGQPLRLVPGIAVSSELFDVLGTPPMLGRTFKPGEDAVGAELVAVLSYSLWQDLGSDPQIVGKPIRLGGVGRTVIGVMPRGFWFPSPANRIWTAAQMNPENRSGRYTLVGRIADGQTMAGMGDPLRSLAATLAANWQYPPAWDKTKTPAITPAREFLVGDVKPSLVATLAAMGVILLIACANVAALMLGQVDARSTELAVRAALGANRQRLVQQLLLESVVIGLLAGVAGAALATVGFGILVSSLPLGELAANARLDWTVFWASTLAALGAALLIAIVPGAAIWRGSSLRATMAATRTGGVASRGGRLESGLVIAQMALAVLLAAGAGLLIRSVANLRAIDPGVETQGIAIVGATMPTTTMTNEVRRQTINGMVEQLRGLPGVTHAAAVQKLPLTGSGDNWGVSVPGRTDITGLTTAFRMVTRDYFAAMGMRILAGRNFDLSDREGSDLVVVINETMAAKLFPGEDPVGRTISSGFDDRQARIIGVVSNAAEARLTDGPVMARYLVVDHLPIIWNRVNFVLRTDSEDKMPALLELARSTIAGVGTQFAVQDTTSMKTLFDRAVGPAGQIVTLLSLLAGLALVLGAVGVYGVISHYVTRRSRDYGIRIALGQQPGRVVGQVVGRGAGLVAIGSALGIVAALFMTKILATLLYGVDATDPVSMAGAVGVLLAVGMLAAFVPARRASLTDPAIVLRES